LHMARAFATAAATSAASFIFWKGNFKFDESFLRVADLKTKWANQAVSYIFSNYILNYLELSGS